MLVHLHDDDPIGSSSHLEYQPEDLNFDLDFLDNPAEDSAEMDWRM